MNKKHFFAFVLAPFTSHNVARKDAKLLNLIYQDVYKHIIKPTVSKELSDCTCYRNDDPENKQDQVYQSICNNIADCDLVIADLVENNPNVLYELGIAHTIGKPSIVLWPKQQKSTPSDITGTKRGDTYSFQCEQVILAYDCNKYNNKKNKTINKKCPECCSECQQCKYGFALRQYVKSYRGALQNGLCRFKKGMLTSVVESSEIANARIKRYYESPGDLYEDLICRLNSKVKANVKGLKIRHMGIHSHSTAPSKFIGKLINAQISCLSKIGGADVQDLISLDCEDQYNYVQTIVKKMLQNKRCDAKHDIKVVPFSAVKNQLCSFIIGNADAFLASSATEYTGAWQGFHFQGKNVVEFFGAHFTQLWNSDISIDLVPRDKQGKRKILEWKDIRKQWHEKGYTYE